MNILKKDPEFEKKLRKAQSVQEVTELFRENGQEISDQEAQRLFEKAHPQLEELSLDEMDAVAGGASSRDYLKDGCAVTVEFGSHCYFSNDGCAWLTVVYDNSPSDRICPDCGGMLCFWDDIYRGLDNRNRYNCSGCGGFYEEYKDYNFIKIR